MARPKKVVAQEEEGTVKKTVEVSLRVDKYLKVSAALEGISDAEYIRRIIEKSITPEVRDMVDNINKYTE